MITGTETPNNADLDTASVNKPLATTMTHKDVIGEQKKKSEALQLLPRDRAIICGSQRAVDLLTKWFAQMASENNKASPDKQHDIKGRMRTNLEKKGIIPKGFEGNAINDIAKQLETYKDNPTLIPKIVLAIKQSVRKYPGVFPEDMLLCTDGFFRERQDHERYRAWKRKLTTLKEQHESAPEEQKNEIKQQIEKLMLEKPEDEDMRKNDEKNKQGRWHDAFKDIPEEQTEEWTKNNLKPNDPEDLDYYINGSGLHYDDAMLFWLASYFVELYPDVKVSAKRRCDFGDFSETRQIPEGKFPVVDFVQQNNFLDRKDSDMRFAEFFKKLGTQEEKSKQLHYEMMLEAQLLVAKRRLETDCKDKQYNIVIPQSYFWGESLDTQVDAIEQLFADKRFKDLNIQVLISADFTNENSPHITTQNNKISETSQLARIVGKLNGLDDNNTAPDKWQLLDKVLRQDAHDDSIKLAGLGKCGKIGFYNHRSKDTFPDNNTPQNEVWCFANAGDPFAVPGNEVAQEFCMPPEKTEYPHGNSTDCFVLGTDLLKFKMPKTPRQVQKDKKYIRDNCHFDKLGIFRAPSHDETSADFAFNTNTDIAFLQPDGSVEILDDNTEVKKEQEDEKTKEEHTAPNDNNIKERTNEQNDVQNNRFLTGNWLNNFEKTKNVFSSQENNQPQERGFFASEKPGDDNMMRLAVRKAKKTATNRNLAVNRGVNNGRDRSVASMYFKNNKEQPNGQNITNTPVSRSRNSFVLPHTTNTEKVSSGETHTNTEPQANKAIQNKTTSVLNQQANGFGLQDNNNQQQNYNAPKQLNNKNLSMQSTVGYVAAGVGLVGGGITGGLVLGDVIEASTGVGVGVLAAGGVVAAVGIGMVLADNKTTSNKINNSNPNIGSENGHNSGNRQI